MTTKDRKALLAFLDATARSANEYADLLDPSRRWSARGDRGALIAKLDAIAAKARSTAYFLTALNENEVRL